MELGERRGRPKELNSKSNFRGVRVSMEDDFHFRKVCEKEGYSSSEGLRMAMKALQYMSENGLTYCLTENKNDDLLNYCLTENEEDETDL